MYVVLEYRRFFCKIHNYIDASTYYSNTTRGCLSTWPFVIGFLVPTHISGQEINFKGRPEMKAESCRALDRLSKLGGPAGPQIIKNCVDYCKLGP